MWWAVGISTVTITFGTTPILMAGFRLFLDSGLPDLKQAYARVLAPSWECPKDVEQLSRSLKTTRLLTGHFYRHLGSIETGQALRCMGLCVITNRVMPRVAG